jgi:hypothetical protein
MWVPGGVVAMLWAHNCIVASSSLAYAPVEMCGSYSFSITMWCENSIQHQPTSSPGALQMGTWNFSGGENLLAIYTNCGSGGVPTPVVGR